MPKYVFSREGLEYNYKIHGFDSIMAQIQFQTSPVGKLKAPSLGST